MSDSSIVIADGDGASVLAAINAAFDTLNTVHAGATAPAALVVGMLWADTANNLMKRLASTGPAVWTTLGTLGTNFGMLPATGGTMTGDLVLSGAGTDLTVGGTLGVTGASTLGNATIGGTLGVTGVATFSNATSQIKGADITAGATTNLATATGDYVVVSSTGTIAISALGTVQAGTVRKVTFSISSGTLSITHNATSLILPGGSNISVTTGDSAEFVSLGSGNWRCTSYQPNTLTAKLWQVVTSSSVSPSITSSGQYLICTATANVTLSLPAAASDYIFAVSNRCSAGIKVTIDPNGAQLVDGLATTDLYPGSAAAYISDGTGWKRMDTGVVANAPSYANNITINASGTWVVPGGVYEARMTVIGGGGGGGGGGSTGATGSTGGSASVTGTAGTLTANGGAGGGGVGGAGGVGGTGTGGTTNITGGSGGAGAPASFAGGGGGGGGFTQKIMAVVPGDTYTITINAAGAGGVASGTSSSPFGGGGGGAAAGQSGGANNGEAGFATYGGAGAAGSGTSGAARVTTIGSGASATVSTGKESSGGSSGAYSNSTTSFVGGAGVSAGAGGGGGINIAGNGGSGGSGRVYIEW